MKRNVFTLHVVFMPESNRRVQGPDQLISFQDEQERNHLLALMREYIAFNALFAWPRMSLEKAERTATQPVVFMTGLCRSDHADIIVVIGNAGTSELLHMRQVHPRSTILWSRYTDADQRDVTIRKFLDWCVETCHDLSAIALKAKVHDLLAKKHGVIFPAL